MIVIGGFPFKQTSRPVYRRSPSHFFTTSLTDISIEDGHSPAEIWSPFAERVDNLARALAVFCRNAARNNRSFCGGIKYRGGHMKYASAVCAAFTAVLLSTTTSAQSWNDQESIRLSIGEVAEYVRSLNVEDDGNAIVEVYHDKVGRIDTMKTIVVSGPAPVKGLSTTSPSMVDEAFKVLPIKLQDLDSAAGVLGSSEEARLSLRTG